MVKTTRKPVARTTSRSPRARRTAPVIRTADRRRATVRTVRQRRRAKATSALQVSMMVLVVSMLVSFVFSSILGNSMLEKTRRERIAAQNRTRVAQTEVNRLRRDLDELSSMESVDRWAMSAGMVLTGSGISRPTVPPVLNAEVPTVASR